MATSVTTLELQIKGHTQGLTKAVNQTSSQLGSIQSKAAAAGTQMKAGFSQVASTFMIATAAIGGAVAIMSDLVSAAQVQEAAEKKLEAALRLSGNTAIDASTKWKTLASEIQEVTTVGDEVTLGVMQMALTMGATEEQLDTVTKGAIGLSKSLGIDLNSATKMVTLGVNGQYSMLTRYIPALRDAGTEAEKAAVFQKALADGFALAEEEAATSAGRMTQLSNSFGDLKEKLGDLLLPVLDAAVSGLSKLVGSIQGVIEGVKSLNAGDMLEATVGTLRGIAEYSTLGLSEWALGMVGLGEETDKTEKKVGEFKQTTTEASETIKNMFRNVAMVSSELAVWQDAVKNATSAEEMAHAEKQVKILQAELDKLEGKTNKVKGSSDAAAKAIKAMEEATRLEAAAAEILSAGLKDSEEAIRSQITAYDERMGRLRELQSIEAMAPGKSAAVLAAEQEEEQLAEIWSRGFQQFDARWQDMGALAADGALSIAASMGSMFNAESIGEAGKNVLKTVGNILIDMAQTFVLAAAAASLGKAVTTFGASLVTDAPWLAAAYAGLEVLRGVVNSYALGTPYVPQDMVARIHKGERVMTAEENQRYNAGQSPEGGNGVLGRRRTVMSARVHVIPDQYAKAGAYSDFQQMRSVF